MALVALDQNQSDCWMHRVDIDDPKGCREQYHRVFPAAAVQRDGSSMTVRAPSAMECLVVELRIQLSRESSID